MNELIKLILEVMDERIAKIEDKLEDLGQDLQKCKKDLQCCRIFLLELIEAIKNGENPLQRLKKIAKLGPAAQIASIIIKILQDGKTPFT